MANPRSKRGEKGSGRKTSILVVTVEEDEFDGPGGGDERLRMNQHPDDDEEDVFNRPDTQVSMEADTRFITGH